MRLLYLFVFLFIVALFGKFLLSGATFLFSKDSAGDSLILADNEIQMVAGASDSRISFFGKAHNFIASSWDGLTDALSRLLSNSEIYQPVIINRGTAGSLIDNTNTELAAPPTIQPLAGTQNIKEIIISPAQDRSQEIGDLQTQLNSLSGKFNDPEFLLSLKGEKGDKGDKGDQGTPGSSAAGTSITNVYNVGAATATAKDGAGSSFDTKYLGSAQLAVDHDVTLGSSAADNLTVNAGASFTSPVTFNDTLTINGGLSQASGAFSGATTTITGSLNVQDSASTTRFYVNPSGYVGIGTASPTSALTIKDSNATYLDSTNLVTNSTFDSDLSSWTDSGSGWEWDNGTAYHDNVPDDIDSLSQALMVEAGSTYILQYDVSANTNWGGFTPYINGQELSADDDCYDNGGIIWDYCPESYSASHTFTATTTGTITLSFKVIDSSESWGAEYQFNGRVDNVTFKKLTSWSSGNSALKILDSNNTTIFNLRADHLNGSLFLGQGSGENNILGQYNLSLGNQSLYSNTTGGYNTALGYQALYSNTTGKQNVAIGYQSLYDNATSTSNIALGYQTLHNHIGIGGNIAIGDSALYSSRDSYFNIAIGDHALYSVTNENGRGNIGIGTNALYGNTTGNYNTAVGAFAMSYNSKGYYNVAFGRSALEQITTGPYNSVLGSYAGQYLTSATNTTLVGFFAGQGVQTSGTETYSIGETTAIGSWSLYQMKTGAEDNTALGYKSGYAVTTGHNNILLGYQAGDALTTGSGNIVIGYDIDMPAVNTDRMLNIGNLIFANGLGNSNTTIATGTVGVGISTPTAKLQVSRSAGGIEKLFQVGTTTATDLFSVNSNGRVGIGTSTPWEAMELALEGDIMVTGNIYKSGTAYTNPDYVFAKYFGTDTYPIPDDYQMLTIDDLRTYIQTYNHLPGFTSSTSTVRSIFDDVRTSIEKLEELTLYTLELDERLEKIAGATTTSVNLIPVIELPEYISNLVVQDSAIFENGIIIKKHALFSGDSVGQAKILAGTTTVEVIFTDEYQYQPIVTVTPNNPLRTFYWLAEKSEKSFKIVLDEAQDEDITFDWHAFASPEAKLFVSDGSISDIKIEMLPAPESMAEILTSPEPTPTQESSNLEVNDNSANKTLNDATIVTENSEEPAPDNIDTENSETVMGESEQTTDVLPNELPRLLPEESGATENEMLPAPEEGQIIESNQ